MTFMLVYLDILTIIYSIARFMTSIFLNMHHWTTTKNASQQTLLRTGRWPSSTATTVVPTGYTENTASAAIEQLRHQQQQQQQYRRSQLMIQTNSSSVGDGGNGGGSGSSSGPSSTINCEPDFATERSSGHTVISGAAMAVPPSPVTEKANLVVSGGGSSTFSTTSKGRGKQNQTKIVDAGHHGHRRSSEWEILEGLKDGQKWDRSPPPRFEGFLLKRRKWPMKGWHKRYFALDNGVLNYSKTSAEMLKGKVSKNK